MYIMVLEDIFSQIKQLKIKQLQIYKLYFTR